jgi:hypothetical protein
MRGNLSKRTSLEISSKNRCRCRDRKSLSEPEIENRPKSSADSIWTSDHLTGHRIDYGNANGNGND